MTITINTFRCKADEQGAEYVTISRNGRDYRILAHSKADAEAALDDYLASPLDDIAGELPSLL